MPQGIPFNKPFICGREMTYISRAIERGEIGSDGFFTRACSRLLAEKLLIRKPLITHSCTAALEMAATLCGLKEGDEVIMPSFTFTSTANAIMRQGAKPVFVDIRPDTLNMDESLVERLINKKTRVILPVHYAGVGCQMDRVMAIARAYRLLVIEDAAQGVNAFHQGRALGSIGHLGAYSFHSTKNYTCGEGGALCVNAPEFVERAEVIRDKGTDRSKFLRGEVDKYTWVDVGSSYVPSEITAAFLYAQLEMLDEIKERRRAVYEFYLSHLRELEGRGSLRLPIIPEGCDTNYHMFHVLLRDQATRDRLMSHLRQHNIQAVSHYVPLHTSPMGLRLGYAEGGLPVTEDASARLLRLPFYIQLTEEEQLMVVHALESFFAGRRSRAVSVS
jgi:dTDP-4-amino-4,6-dideoxygalactose transaminase